jgi:DNA repair exonuclease SbcCD ATPase subunit
MDYAEAVEAMEKAVVELQGQRLQEAQVPERQALQKLLHAEARVKERQMQRSQGGGGGRGSSLDELSRLFDEEMDKLKSKYETLRQSPSQNSREQMDDALEKVKELARRQQQFNQQMRDLAQSRRSAEERKRQIEELRRQQEEIRREAQELTRQMQQNMQQNSNAPREAQEQLRRATNEMNNASNNLRRSNTDMAAARGRRALDRLRRLEESLQRNQKESLREQMQEIDQRFQELNKNQKELSQNLQQMSEDDKEVADELKDAAREQERLQQEYRETAELIKQMSERTRESRNQLARDMNDMKNEVEKADIEKKMATARKLMEKNQLGSAIRAEENIDRSLEKLSDKLVQLQTKLADSKEEKLELALNETRKLRENLESLQRQMQQNEQSDGEATSERRASDRTQAGPGETGRLPSESDTQRMNEELAKSLHDLDRIREAVKIDTSLSRQMQNISDDWHGVVRNYAGAGARDRFQLIEDMVIDPLRSLEAELSQTVEFAKNKEKLFLAREERIPQEYEDLVEKYYEALSRTDRSDTEK